MRAKKSFGRIVKRKQLNKNLQILIEQMNKADQEIKGNF